MKKHYKTQVKTAVSMRYAMGGGAENKSQVSSFKFKIPKNKIQFGVAVLFFFNTAYSQTKYPNLQTQNTMNSTQTLEISGKLNVVKETKLLDEVTLEKFKDLSLPATEDRLLMIDKFGNIKALGEFTPGPGPTPVLPCRIFPYWKMDGNNLSGADCFPNAFIGTTDNTDFIIKTSGTERMRVNAGGNVNVSGKISAAAYTSNSPLIFEAPLGTERMRIDDVSGNVGIGTTAANGALQFSNSQVSRKIVLYETANDNHQYYGFGINSAMLRYQTDNIAADHVFFAAASSTSSNELMRIKGNGNVGIGTTVTNAKLDVNGTGNFSGNVSIGSTSQKLEVRNQIKMIGNDAYIPIMKIINEATTANNNARSVLQFNNINDAANGDLCFIMQWETGGSALKIRGRPANDFVDYMNFDLKNNNVYVNHNKSGTATYGNFLVANGNVGIGTTCIPTGVKLAVFGTIKSTEWIVDPDGWCDFALAPNYKKMHWREKERIYTEKGFLPYMASGAEIEKNGLSSRNLKGMMLNIEEDRLDITEIFERLEKLEAENKELKQKIEKLEKK